MQNNKKYWLTWGIIFAMITVILYFGINYFQPSRGIVDPSSSLLSILPTLFTLCLNIVELLPIGYFVSLALGYLFFVVFPLPAIIIPIVSAFVNGMFWGWIYGKIKSRNVSKISRNMV